jgi:hypothetical protein
MSTTTRTALENALRQIIQLERELGEERVFHLTKVFEKVLPSGRTKSRVFMTNGKGYLLHDMTVVESEGNTFDPSSLVKSFELQLELKKMFSIEEGSVFAFYKVGAAKTMRDLEVIRWFLKLLFAKEIMFNGKQTFKVYKVYRNKVSLAGFKKFYFTAEVDGVMLRSIDFTENNTPELRLKIQDEKIKNKLAKLLAI